MTTRGIPDVWLERAASPRSLAALFAVFALVQVATVLVVSRWNGIPAAKFLGVWDAGWYLRIAESGYSGPAWAFFPAFPWLMRVTSAETGFSPLVAGTLLSALFLVAATWLYLRHVADDARGFPRGTNLGWLLFVFSPASWVFLHPHTESLYLLLLVATLACWTRCSWWLAAIVAGFAALTKNQGVLLAVATGFAAAADMWRSADRGVRMERAGLRFLLVGLISGAIYSIYPVYQYAVAGDPFLHLSSQIHWRPEMTLASYFKTLWFGNPWQNLRPGSLLHHAFFFAMIYVVYKYARQYPRNLIWIYFALHAAIMPSSGELVSDLRYASVLIVLWVFAGDNLSRTRATPVVACAAVLLHVAFLYSAVMGRWAY